MGERKLTKRQSLIVELCRKFPSSSTMQLARLAMEQLPKHFPNFHAARCTVMQLRGEMKGRGQKQAEERGTLRKKVIAPLPESHAEKRLPFVVENCKRVAILSDVHIPYHDQAALKVALKCLDKYQPDTIVLNGDILDFEAISDWDSAPNRPDTFMELQLGSEFLWHLRQRFRKSRIIFKPGNHEDRYEKYLINHAPKLFNVDAARFSWHTALGINDIGVEMTAEKQRIEIGKLTVFHGHEVRLAGVAPAKALFSRVLMTALAGHVHRESSYMEPTGDGRIIGTWTTGCLCDKTPGYATENKWTTGFAVVDVARDGEFVVTPKKVIDGKVY